MLKLDLIIQVMNQIDYCLKQKKKKVIGLMKDELSRKMMTKFVELRIKTYSYVIDDGGEDKNQKAQEVFHIKKCNPDRWQKNNKFRCKCKKRHVCEKDYIWNPSTCNCKNGKYLANIMDDSAITCDEVIESYDEETKTIPTNFNEKKATCEKQNFYILLSFYINHYSIIDSCQYLLLFDKISNKTKTFITISRYK